MSDNLFEQFRRRKAAVRGVVEKAAALGWLAPEEAAEVKRKLDEDKLVLGVIGQMKCGKSTFLNSFVFEDTVLPAATTPMTAALSVIGYGAQRGLTAEFYSDAEWRELQDRAAQDPTGKTANEASAIKAAQELTSKASLLGGELSQWLGKTKTDSLEHLVDYVGAEGRYVSITKAVRITMPLDYLKGVEIVDTPGFNDPIVSREERTRDFLKTADAVVLMLYAGRPFDVNDKNILTKQVAQAAIGQVIVGVNKYDIPSCDQNHPETEEEIVAYVKAQIAEAVKDTGSEALSQALADCEPIPLSAEMALIGKMDRAKLDADAELREAFKRHCDNFGLGTQRELYDKSLQDNLVTAIKQVIEKKKGELLLRKPLARLRVVAGEKEQAAKEAVTKAEGAVKSYSGSDAEIDERIDALEKCNRRITRKLDGLSDDVEEALKGVLKTARRQLLDLVGRSCQTMEAMVESQFGYLDSPDVMYDRLRVKVKQLYSHDLQEVCESVAAKCKGKITDAVDEFFEAVRERDLLAGVLDDERTEDLEKDYRRKIKVEVDDGDMFDFEVPKAKEDSWLYTIVNGATYGMFEKLGNLAAHDMCKKNMLADVHSVQNDFDPDAYLAQFANQKEAIVKSLRKLFHDELLTPMLEQAHDARLHKAERKTKLQAAEEQLQKAKADLAETQRQATELRAAIQQADNA